ncbi:uncharacterized protein MYCFIDRAFT_171760 [Pseudocercospora fijiensis CIRAD86]|uniref:Isochorismatase-like domain-containing protein n=1 Tax=Pseudocercospora fijiensis (strain CIRAD86) TaxID=383855 RepID=M2Z810_PSEFD|nr:uncharacterized protein MYCFIDRAFT_171760 [Pseudocercospora fijiensis CIRAD86]EME85910.1 hypothetical protein MYCFIDRAFT_171760 [Pseudocercospora fijiensis CIRAD86]
MFSQRYLSSLSSNTISDWIKSKCLSDYIAHACGEHASASSRCNRNPSKMKFRQYILNASISLLTPIYAQIYDTSNSMAQITATVDNTSTIPNRLGNHYNFWTISPDNTTWDLTRSSSPLYPTTSPKTIPMLGFRQKKAIIETQPHRVRNRRHAELLPPSISTTQRYKGAEKPRFFMGELGNRFFHDLITMPPAFLSNFSIVRWGSWKRMMMGRRLIWERNCVGELGIPGFWGDLWPLYEEGIKVGTDLLFHKSEFQFLFSNILGHFDRFSGLWGAQTPLGLYLQESGITSLFIGGVNSDQCVWSTLIDAFFKGFDVVYVQDCTGTTSPWYAEEMARYNADANGFLAKSTDIIEALDRQATGY